MKRERAYVGHDPIFEVSLGGANSGDIDAEFPCIALPGWISFVHKFNADRMPCLHSHAYMTYRAQLGIDVRPVLLEPDEGVPADIGFGFMGKAIVQKTENSKSSSSKRRLRIAAALVLVVAGICGGSLWWHRNAVQEHDQAFAP